MLTTRFFKRTMPIAVGTALVAAAMSATPASASSGWWASKGGGAQGFYNHVDDSVTACDTKTDGRKAAVEILSGDGRRLLTTVTDNYNDGRCSWRRPTLFQGTHKIRVCVKKGKARPVKCGAMHTFEV
ncbi:hypothetical protein ACFVXC_07915 [Streptomyces sp. NPDC058257]|uniref:hypothetical protein n=1 Tax=Streptomyces sp. NPDC058257 TaxID=3346409 RepID=UPI0036EEFF4A